MGVVGWRGAGVGGGSVERWRHGGGLCGGSRWEECGRMQVGVWRGAGVEVRVWRDVGGRSVEGCGGSVEGCRWEECGGCRWECGGM